MKAVVLHDVYRYETDPGVVKVAYKGDEVDVSDAEFERGSTSEPAGLAKPATARKLEKLVGKMTSAELDEKAVELEIEEWDSQANVAAKRDAIEAYMATRPSDENE